ncbi:pyridoxine 5'-phosphate synthase [Sneathiella sp. P13V-1]|uniref:pyridoxine 5'-phosphate synthase n=1 Tax=Sneathiella sp. P13V-1 TaxID=2697366 RepID=UPI00187B611F|nr:pyridoxine 5'-phosphate synthase [Sneathiella sp. P13V-1]MBE7638332.1 pyridoxine 5'-phosphate synthase [Sneathiella sp. P13V-1]
MQHLRLGVNIDHVATIRNARGGIHPDPLRAAKIAEEAGADGITAHLREDRRHIADYDIKLLSENLTIPLNFEMAATEEMLEIALAHKPHAACLVPEKREERTTEGGLDVLGGQNSLQKYVSELKNSDIRVSLFVEPDPRQLEAAARLGADIVELHVGPYCDAETPEERDQHFKRILAAAKAAEEFNLECHAGHGLTYETVEPVAAIPSIVELNIGHFLIGEAIFVGLDTSIKEMRRRMDIGRAKAVEQSV